MRSISTRSDACTESSGYTGKPSPSIAAVRDRTWGRRPEDRPRQAAYVTGVASAAHGFLAVTNVKDERTPISYGFLRRDERTVRLTAGERRVERDPATGWITRIELQAHDAEGRELAAVGEPVSRIIINRHTFIDINSLVRWHINGEIGWGEDQDMWPVHRWSRMRQAEWARQESEARFRRLKVREFLDSLSRSRAEL